MKRVKKIANAVRSAVIVALVALLLTTSCLYIYTQNYSSHTAYPAFPEEHLHLLSNDASFSMNRSKSDFIVPSFVAVTDNDGASFGNFGGADSDTTADDGVTPTQGTAFVEPGKNAVWAEFERILPLLSECTFEKIAFEDKSHALGFVEELFEKNNKMYCEFAKPLPLAAIAVFFENTYNDSILYKESFFAKYMILTADENETESSGVTLFVVDEDANVISAVPHTAVKYNHSLATQPEHLKLYEVNLMCPVLAAKHGIASCIPIFERTVIQSPLYKEDFSESFSINTDSDALSAILSAFAMNPNNTNRFTNPDGTVGFVENAGQLEVSPNGEISFVANSDAGISMSKLIGYVPEGARENGYSFEHKVEAVCTILEAMDKKMLGKDARLVLKNVMYDNSVGNTLFCFSYCIDGTEIETGRENDAVFAFSTKGLSAATLFAEIYTDTGDAYSNIPNRSALAAALENDGKTTENGLVNVLCAVKSKYVGSDGGSVFVPVWTANFKEMSPDEAAFVPSTQQEPDAYEENSRAEGGEQ